MIHCNGYQFRPGWWPTLATALVLPLLLALGFWQLDRAQQKKSLQAAYSAQLALAPVSLDEITVGDPAQRYRRVTVAGRFDSRQLLLDNQRLEGRVGYHVYAPLIAPDQRAVLVNLGWVAAHADRRLPTLAPLPEGLEHLSGRLSQPANPAITLGALGTAGPWPQVVQHIDYDAVAEALARDVVPAVVLLDSEVAFGYRRQWQPTFGGVGPARHRGYAIQWFGLAIALVAIYGIVNWRRPLPPAGGSSAR